MSKLHYYRFVLRYLSLVLRKNKTMGATLEAVSARQPDAVAVAFGDERISYGELNRRVNRRAHLFRSQGVGKGEVVCLVMENRPEFVETVIALAKLGASAALINHQLKGSSLAHCLNVSRANRVVVGLECLEPLQVVLPQLETIRPEGVYVDTRWVDYSPPGAGMHDVNALLQGQPDTNPPRVPLNSLDTVLYIYTSGTTGLPKAARINHYRWYAAGLAMGRYALELGPHDVLYCPLPLFHSNGTLIAMGSALVNGATLALTRRFSARAFWEEAAAYGATAFIYIGEVLRYLVNSPPQPAEAGHRVRRILGNGLRPDIWKQARERFRIPVVREFYASTEGNAVTINMDNTDGSVGTAVLAFADNLALVRFDVEREDYVRDAQGFCQRCAPGQVGELMGQIKSTTPFHGYTEAKDTEKKILRNVFKQGDAFFRTGDLMKTDAAGRYSFVDRIGDTYRWKGENVSTQEVQEILAGFEGIHLCNVYGVAVPGAEGRVGMAALQMEAGREFDGRGFYRFAVERLAAYSVPAFVRLVGEMDVTGTYKLRKVELQRQGFDPAQVDGPVFYLHRDASTYAPLDAATYQRLGEGALKF